MHNAFTERKLQALKPPPEGKRLMVHDALVPGLAVRVTDQGAKTFVLIQRFPGSDNPTARALGRYGELTIDSAREKARRWLEWIHRGIDPAQREAEERAGELKRGAETFGKTFEAYVEKHLAKLRTGRDVEVIMRRTLAGWMPRPLAGITRKDVIEVVYAIHDAGSPIAANRVLAYVKKFFSEAVQRGLVDASPAVLVKKPAKESAKERVLSDDEIRAIWKACSGNFGAAVQFMFATAARRNEAGAVPWSEIDMRKRLWHLPAKRTKPGRKLDLPLNKMAIAVLKGQAVKVNLDKPIYVFSTLGDVPINGWSKGKAQLDRGAGLEEEWTLHDIRRTVATNLGRLGVDRITISKILNHADGAVTAIYDRYGREADMVEAMAKWGDRLEEILKGRL